MSASSPDILYHTIPQSDGVPTPSDIELDADDEVSPGRPSIGTASNISVDPRIRWINFTFGSALLLPWNGAALFSGSHER